MRPELALQLKVTTYQEFKEAILNKIKEYTEEHQKLGRLFSEEDQKAIAAVNEYLARENTSGEILRQDLKTILRDGYGYFGRFRKSLAKRLEALRQKPEFSPAALRRGDAQLKHPNLQILQLQQQLQTEKSEKETAVKEQKKLAAELKASADDQLILMEENVVLKKQILFKNAAEEIHKRREAELLSQCEALRELLSQSGILIPSHLASPMPMPSRTVSEHDAKHKSWSWKESTQTLSPSVFRKETLSGVPKEQETLPTPLRTPPMTTVHSHSGGY